MEREKKDDRKQNVLWALSFGFFVNRYLSFKVAYIGTRTQESTGYDSESFIIGLNSFW